MAAKRTGLGRGIGALIPTDEGSPARPVDVFFPTSGSAAPSDEDSGGLAAVPGARLANLDPADIVPNAAQPRHVFVQEELDELIHSIREFGVLQPIVVRPLEDSETGAPKYELVMGERRLRATKHLGLATIPAVVKNTADESPCCGDALLENLHRANLNPLEEASAYQQFLADFGITQDQLAERIGRSRPQITNTLRLLRLPEGVQQRVAAGVLTRRPCSSDPVDRRCIDHGAPRRQDRERGPVGAGGGGGRWTRLDEARSVHRSRARVAVKASWTRSPSVLETASNTRVKVTLGSTKGSIVIDFASVGDLNRILGELGEPGFR
jgi:ParB family chromosome partitioning protein